MRWNDIIEEIRIIQNALVPEATWQVFLDKHLQYKYYDSRTSISGALSHACIIN
jgi:hypothetical protein